MPPKKKEREETSGAAGTAANETAPVYLSGDLMQRIMADVDPAFVLDAQARRALLSFCTEYIRRSTEMARHVAAERRAASGEGEQESNNTMVSAEDMQTALQALWGRHP